jgi:hypothetical protein
MSNYRYETGYIGIPFAVSFEMQAPLLWSYVALVFM